MFVVIQFVVDIAVRITQRNVLVTEWRKSDLMRLSLLIKTSTWHTISSLADVFGFPLRCLSSHPVLPLSAPYPKLWPWYYTCIVLSNLTVNFYRYDSLHTQKSNSHCIWRHLTKIPIRIPSLNCLCGNKTRLRTLSWLYNETDDLHLLVFWLNPLSDTVQWVRYSGSGLIDWLVQCVDIMWHFMLHECGRLYFKLLIFYHKTKFISFKLHTDKCDLLVTNLFLNVKYTENRKYQIRILQILET